MLLVVAALCTPAIALADATIVIVNADGPNEGFNDPTPAVPVGGNPGTTIGAQRLAAFQYAANQWGALLDSGVVIRINANFDPLTCNMTSAVLGSAGAVTAHRDFTGAPVAGTWYNAALANKLAGVDLDPTSPDINARFNSALNGTPSCLGGGTWYYGFDHNDGPNQTDLIPVLMHEFGHGLGFQSFVSKTAPIGALLQGLPDAFLNYMLDNQTNMLWRDMTNQQRAASMINGQHVVWTGANLLAAAPGFLTPGTPQLTISSPAAIAGAYSVGTAEFGPPLSATPVAGNLQLALDATSSSLGCNAIVSNVVGKIAVMDRGTCAFTVKVKNAQLAGAIAAIIVDNAAGSPPAGLGGTDATITIPSVRVTQADGNKIKMQLGAGVSGSLLVDLAVLAGADAANRTMLYTPDPIVAGSSVSHFDTSTTPNTLMEPAINLDLTANVDLTLPLFRDLGWYPDSDNDLVPDGTDNCQDVANTNQEDNDDDGAGDACDSALTTSAATYTVLQPIAVNWFRMPGNATDWIGLAPVGSDLSTVSTWVYTQGAVDGATSFNTALLSAGTYVARGFVNNSYEMVGQSAPFTVTTESGATLTTDASTYSLGQAVVVTWSNLSTSATNWIAYAPAGSPDTTVIRWVYTGGQASGSHTFDGPATAGPYVARSFISDTYNKSGESAVFTVATSASVTTSASTYGVGESIVVSWSGLSTSATNWIAYAPMGSPDTTVTRWVYTGGLAAGSVTLEGAAPGTYVARSFVSDTYNKSGESAPFAIQ